MAKSQEATEQIRALDLALSEREGRIAELSCELEEAGERAKSLDQAVEVRDGRIAELNLRIRHYEGSIQQLENEIFEMRRSIVWQLTMKYHNCLVERILPQRTKRRNIYNLGLKGCRLLVNEGMSNFWLGFRDYLRGYQINRQSIIPLSESTDDEEILCIKPYDLRLLKDKKIAIVIHVYYVDLIEEICSYLKNIPIKFSLLISVRTEEDRIIIAKYIECLPFVDHAEIKVVENRGRDIAPMLVDFASRIKNYEYICKLHTKKSLYTGNEVEAWRRYLYDMLLGSGERVQAILSAFEAYPSIGLIYPETYYGVPYWAHTWLSNKGIASSFLSRLGIPFDPDQYIDFPAGSMFWARSEALEPLLELGLKIENFPEEHGQTDGTLHHTIERCFAIVGHLNEFKYLIIQDKENQIFNYRSRRNIHQYFVASFETGLRNGSPAAEVISFDIFDTLLIRPFANPDFVFDYMEKSVQKEFGVENFRKIRKLSENVAREVKQFKNDVTLSEIYSIFAEEAKIDANTAKQLLDLEVSTETSILEQRKDVVKVARDIKRSGKRLIIVTDTYFEKNHIEHILSSKGIDFYDAIFISSEIGMRKDRGDLWDYVLDREYVEKERLLHVGDNEQSDIQVLLDRGFMHPIHVMKPSILFRQIPLGKILYNSLKPYNSWEQSVLFGMISNFYCSDPYPKELFESDSPLKDPYAFGYIVFGPIAFSYLSWLIKVSKKDGVEQLKFLSREGYLLQRAFEAIANHPSIKDRNLTLPKAEYFLCSRRAVLFASLKTVNDISLLLERHYQGTLREFLEKRLNVSDMASIKSRLGTEALEKNIHLPGDYNYIYDSIFKVFDILSSQAEKERIAILQYCNEQGIAGSEKVGLVDVGYLGSIQKGLSHLLGRSFAGYYFVTETQASKLMRPPASIIRAYFGEFVDPPKCDLPIFRFSLLLESVLTAPDGQLICFQKCDAGIKPIFKGLAISQKEFPKILQIHQGILKFIEDILDRFGPGALDIEFPKDAIQCCYEKVITGQLKIGDLASVLSVEDDFCGNPEISVMGHYAKKEGTPQIDPGKDH